MDHECSISAWGKLRHSASPHEREARLPLTWHCLDVAQVFRALVDQPKLARLGELSAGQKDRLAVIAFLHDFGKCNRGFQAKADPAACDTAGHVMEAIALLCELHRQWPEAWSRLIEDVALWFKDKEQALQILLASLSHHGRPVSWNDYEASGVERAAHKWWKADAHYDPLSALAELALAAHAAFPAAFTANVPPIDATAAFQQRFAGLLMLADWIGSDTQFFPFDTPEGMDRASFARQAAERALRSIGLVPPEPRATKPFEAVFGFEPTPLQRKLAQEIPVVDDSRLLLVESDTGSGKTEAALAWFFRLYTEGQVDGLYFALPTRVAARELYERVRRAIEAAFDSAGRPGPVLLAAPGYVKVDGVPMGTLLTDPARTLWDDNQHDRQREQLWSAERPKRFLAAPIAVGTIDQALLSALQVKHSLLRSVCLDRHLLVVDEVHASDPYMRAALRGLLRGHLARGGWALLLSATLGEAAAAEYYERSPVALDEALQRPYPLLTTRSQAHALPTARARSIKVNLSATLTQDDALLPAIIQALEHCARVLIVCNTVARANALFRRVESALEGMHRHLLPALFAHNGVRCPHHGRFAREDRELLDAAVTAQLGKGSPAGARLIIGTQTLEQSLDIDADWLITDLAPMDVLIQRFGRLHRHARQDRPPTYTDPQAVVRVPEKDLSAYLDGDHLLRAPAGLGSVYADGRVLASTWANLQENPKLELPGQARARIESTTHPEALDALPDKAWRRHGHALWGIVRAEILQAQRSLLDEKPFGDLHYNDTGERVLTRFGQPTFDIPLEKPQRSPFGATIERISIPVHWLQEKAPPECLCAEPMEDGFRFAIGKRRFRYTRFGLEKVDA